VAGRRFVAIALVELLQRVVALSRIGLCRVGVKSGGDDRDDAAPHARFAPKADKQPNISVRPLCVPEAAVSNRSKTVALFDYLVGAGEQHERNGDTNRLCSDRVYNEIETDALLTGPKFGFCARRQDRECQARHVAPTEDRSLPWR
jgi:hypothetical protein